MEIQTFLNSITACCDKITVNDTIQTEEPTQSVIYIFNKWRLTMNNNKSTFDPVRVGATISRLRKAAGYTQAGLADALNISFQAVSNWERGVSQT